MSTTYARTLNGNTIYAAISDGDGAGNSIINTYATKSEVQAIDEVPAVTDQDNGKILQASYSQGESFYENGLSLLLTISKSILRQQYTFLHVSVLLNLWTYGFH